jgi:N-glycosidase YbiA
MIDSFTGQYRFLSNFYPCWIEFNDSSYPSVEHAYQAAKTIDEQLRLWFQESIVTASEAKKAGRRLKIREDWEDVKLSIMHGLLRSKFNQTKLKDMLLATNDEELVEGNTWGDTFWGVCRGVGENNLGKLLMRTREEIRAGN